MIEQQNICPYTGLRSFTEEESLYFKGRDLQIDQITSLLEQNKFLMVTGASGEGKSSLIYAGLIPNAKAGFFKARYTNWVVADFRPERSPVSNMATALAETFSTQASTIETELRRGFSSLIDLYTNSGYYIDEGDEQWIELDESHKKDRKRKAANLMILVDQFEEFFTNPENFYNEAPSQDSQIVVNLVLETARIAIKRNIPVYIVCTMRSDYIGQCSAFRGLPEYIGFSQFFVPRLKRRDLKQVIEEPAILSGNRISQRLIERLVYDIADGVDQLPILQHALSQIWLAARHGQEEMDLIHYAKVGGMPAMELPDEEQAEFQRWFDQLPPVRQKYYQDTGLNKVIEIHASVLYENAWEYYNTNHPGNNITQQEAKRIIGLTFSCLTKIDNSRAVRNRMSLGEITGIINIPSITTEVVNGVLNIYREEGNSFIRPFKTVDPATHQILAGTVLDITHESLIRNWNKLNTWAKQEFEFYTTYLDFRKQLGRWKDSKKSNGFLLPIGPLTYFESWYHKCKPNAGWIKRYAEIGDDPEKSTADAENVLADVREFIRRSARKVAVTRVFMKYGPKRIAVVVAVVAMIMLSGFYWYDAEQKQNSRVIKQVRSETATLMKSKELGFNLKALPLLVEERYDPGYMMNYLSGLDARSRLSLSLETYAQVLIMDKFDSSKIKSDLKDGVRAGFTELLAERKDLAFLLNALNKFTTLLTYENYYNPPGRNDSLLRDFSDAGYRLALDFFGDKTRFQATISPEINYAVQQWLTFGPVTPGKLHALLNLCSPFETAGNGKELFDIYYAKGSYEINGRVPNDFNGGYHTLASLYAALGEETGVIQCLDAIKRSGQDDYFTGSLFNNYNNILAILYQFGHRDKAAAVVTWLGTNYPTNTPLTIYRNSVIRSGYLSRLFPINIRKNWLTSNRGYFFPNLCLANRKVFNELADDYEKLINNIKDPSERNYLMAINKKRRAVFTYKYQYDRGIKPDMESLNGILQQAVDHFRLVDGQYLDEKVSVTLSYFSDGVRTRNFKRRHIFTYPDYMEGWFADAYHSDLFFNFIDQHGLMDEFYKTPEDLNYIHFWLAKAYEVKPNADQVAFDHAYPVSDRTLERILALPETHPQGKNFDTNLACLLLANRAFSRNDTAGGLDYYRRFNKKDFAGSRDKYEYLEKSFFMNQLKDLCVNLALLGKRQAAIALTEKFDEEHEKAFVYIFMAEQTYMKNTDPATFVYLDSVFSKSKDIDFSQFNFGPSRNKDFRIKLLLLMSRIGGKELNALSNNILAEIIEGNKDEAVQAMVYGIAEEGNLYRARQVIPPTSREIDDLRSRAYIVWQACLKKEQKEGRRHWTTMDDFVTRQFNYIFFIPN